MANENELLGAEERGTDIPFDLDAFEVELERQIENGLEDLDELKLAEKNIGNTEYLGNVVMNVVWEQFIGQVADPEFDQDKNIIDIEPSKEDESKNPVVEQGMYEKLKAEGKKLFKKLGQNAESDQDSTLKNNTPADAILQQLKALLQDVSQNLTKWIGSKDKNTDSLLSSIKKAITSFVDKLKIKGENALNHGEKDIIAAIGGPLARTLSNAVSMIKEGFRSLQGAITYLKDPANRGKSLDVMTMEMGKIVIAGATTVGGLLLGEVIEKGLMAIPAFAVEIPPFGSLANVIGVFMGTLVAGVLGAIALNFIDKALEKRKRTLVVGQAQEKRGEILANQEVLLKVNDEQLKRTKHNFTTEIEQRHQDAGERLVKAQKETMGWSAENIFAENRDDDSAEDEDFQEIDELLNALLDSDEN